MIKASLTIRLGWNYYIAFLKHSSSIWMVRFGIGGVCKEQLLPQFSVKIRSPTAVHFWVTLENILFPLR